MFDNLSDKLQGIFKKLRGQAVLTESNIADTLKEVRLALLEADVNYDIAREFVDAVKNECIGKDVLKSVTPGQQLVKLIYDRLVDLMGSSESEINLTSSPTVIMLVGLHGSGKTTTAAKLANYFKKKYKRVMLVAADIYRPAAIDQLEILGKELGIPVFLDRAQIKLDLLVSEAKKRAKHEGIDVVIIDTAGRFQIDDEMIQELVVISQVTNPSEIFLVADAALGQEAVSVSDTFNKALGLTGVILTKLDGDVRGGAALSIKKVINCPIKMVGVGEKIEDLEVFYPDRMASRILGMGDVVSLVEKAAEEIDKEEAEKLEQKLKANKFDLNDFLSQIKHMKKLGGIEKILKMLSGGKALTQAANVDAKQFSKMEAIICSMTMFERENPEKIDFSRKKRIVRGSGTSLQDVNSLIEQFLMMKKIIKRPSLMGGVGGGMMPPGIPSLPKRGSNFTKKKDRKKHKRR